MTNWIILRTSGAKTLPLANSLSGSGIECWTPRYVHASKPQAANKPVPKHKAEREIAIIPTFLFAKADHIHELWRIINDPVSRHPSFSIFRHLSRIPLIADHEIEALRSEEARSRVKSRRSKRRALVLGQRVRFSEGAFAGMSGIIEKVKGQAALIAFGGNFSVEIASWQMPTDLVCNESSSLGNAA